MRKIRNMRVRLRSVPVVAIALAGITALGIVVAAPASADPATTYVTVGSDTTQNVMDQFMSDEFPGQIGSWDAVNPVTQTAHEIITPKPGCSMTRPNGSGEGLAALRKSINPTTSAAQLPAPPSPGCVDFSRSSSGPGTAQANDGVLQYVPFALDAVGTATGPATATGGAVATTITTADQFTEGTATSPGNLIKLYRDCAAVTVGGVTYDPNIPAATGDVQIHLYVPQAGSGTRSFWASTLNFSGTTLPSCVHDTIVGTTNPVEEHDGTVYAGDPAAFGPFSIAQWVSQSFGHNDRRHNAVLHNLAAAATGGTAVTPLSGGALNPNYPITREVYNVVLRTRIVNTGTASAPSAGFDPTLAALLGGGLNGTSIGANSQLCQDSFTIANFGFAALDGVTTPDTCGAVTNALRAFTASAPL